MTEHVFTPEDIPAIVRELIDYCKKWGLWRDASVVAGGMRYSYYTPKLGPEFYGPGGLLEGCDDVWANELSDVERERLFSAPIYDPNTGGYEFVCLCSPEPLLDMTFEGPLYDLLHQTRYSTELAEMSPEGLEEVMKLLLDRSSQVRCEAGLTPDIGEEAMSDAKRLMKRLEGWDPEEFDTCEDYLEFTELEDPVCVGELPLRAELREALELSGDAREDALYKAFMMKKLCDRYFDGPTIVDYGKLEARVYEGFTDIFDRYGLRYEMCSGTTLTAYRS